MQGRRGDVAARAILDFLAGVSGLFAGLVAGLKRLADTTFGGFAIYTSMCCQLLSVAGLRVETVGFIGIGRTV